MYFLLLVDYRLSLGLSSAVLQVDDEAARRVNKDLKLLLTTVVFKSNQGEVGAAEAGSTFTCRVNRLPNVIFSAR